MKHFSCVVLSRNGVSIIAGQHQVPPGGFCGLATERTKVWTVSEYEADPDTALTETDEQLEWLLNSERVSSIIRGSDFGTAQEDLDIVH